MINTLLSLLFLALLVWAAYTVLNMIEMPPQIRQIAGVILAVLFLIALFGQLGLMPGVTPLVLR